MLKSSIKVGRLFVVGVLVAYFLAGAHTWKIADTIASVLSTPEHNLSELEIREVYNNLNKYAGLTTDSTPTLYIVKNKEVNAHADCGNNSITLYTGIIEFTNNKNEIAAVLGHELAHLLLQHCLLNPTGEKNYQTILEGNADKFGVYLVLRAGYDVCMAKNLWVKLRNKEGDYGFNADHPNYSYRTWQFDFPGCK